jgi:hypothetical protein
MLLVGAISCEMCRDSLVRIVTGYGLDGRGSNSNKGKIFLCTASRSALGPTQPFITWLPRLPTSLSPGVKRQGREADHSPLSSAEVPHMFSRYSA